MTRSYICLDNSEKFRNLEEAIRGLTKDLHSMQTTINGINQRLYVKASVALVPLLNFIFAVKWNSNYLFASETWGSSLLYFAGLT